MREQTIDRAVITAFRWHWPKSWKHNARRIDAAGTLPKYLQGAVLKAWDKLTEDSSSSRCSAPLRSQPSDLPI
jgi:hypothetical protein